MKTSLAKPKMVEVSAQTKSGIEISLLSSTAEAIGIKPAQIKSSKRIKREVKAIHDELDGASYFHVGLSSAQLNAINAPLPTTVLAAAGTGKTTTILHRIAKANQIDELSLDAVFMTTFTRKASTEMINRLQSLIHSVPKYAGTFHRNALQLIDEYPVLLTVHGYDSTFELLDNTDIDHLIAEKLKPYMAMLKTMDINSRMAKKWMREGINALKGKGRYTIVLHKGGGDVTKENILILTDKFKDLPAAVAYGAYHAFQLELKKMSALDFNDVMALPTFAMRDEDIRYRVNKNFRLVIVDEYQDCSGLQFEMAEYLSHDGKYLYLVGDEDQLIYGWRDADLNKVMESYSNPDSNTVFLEDNYRSQAHIPRLGAAVITQNTMRSNKVMRAAKPATSKVVNVIPYDTYREADYVVKCIRSLILNGVTPSEIAIISRTNDYPTIIETELLKNKIDYNFVKAYNFFEYKEVKDAAAYCRLALNTSNDLAFKRVINYPKRKNGKMAVNKIEALAHHKGGLSLFEALGLQENITTSNQEFIEVIHTLGQMMKDDMPVKLVMNYLLQSISLEYVLHAEHGIQEGDIRFERVKKLAMILDILKEEYDSYEDTLKVLNDEMMTLKKQPDERKVQMMTIHGSKGLEFKHVFIIGATNGMMPSLHGEPQPIDKHQEWKNTSIEEERRLFYVAITRAKETLVISSPKYVYRIGSVSEAERTMFLDDLEDLYIVKPLPYIA